MQDFGALLIETVVGLIVISMIITAIVVGAASIGLTYYFTKPPSEAEVLKEEQRQQVIEKLTPEERELLGV